MSQLTAGAVPQLRVGPITNADGTFALQRGGKEAETIAALAKGKYAEASARGQMFSIATAAAGQAWLLTNTAAVMLDIVNPSNSGVRVEICKVSLGYVSGTLPAGDISHGFYAAQGSTVPTGGTAITPQCLDVGKSATTLVIAGNGRSLAGVPTLGRPLASSFVELATTANGLQQVIDDLDGEITLEPGTAYCLIGIAGAGGSSPVVHLGVTVRVLPLV